MLALLLVVSNHLAASLLSPELYLLETRLGEVVEGGLALSLAGEGGDASAVDWRPTPSVESFWEMDEGLWRSETERYAGGRRGLLGDTMTGASVGVGSGCIAIGYSRDERCGYEYTAWAGSISLRLDGMARDGCVGEEASTAVERGVIRWTFWTQTMVQIDLSQLFDFVSIYMPPRGQRGSRIWTLVGNALVAGGRRANGCDCNRR